jgi:protein SFI1
VKPTLALSEKSVPRSEYAPSVTRQPSPARSIVSVPDSRRSKSPHIRRAPTLSSDAGIEGGRLWSAIKDLKQPRPPRNL